jgi:putative hydrolase of the HAD superfamily
MKKRKPDANIYEQVLDENNLKPNETLFLDDNADNIAGANALGIRTVYVVTPDHIITYFNGK